MPIERGGPVRMLVPEGYGFKSIKWLNRVVLTRDYRANDTYAERQNNDPSSPMKTLARMGHPRPADLIGGESPVTMRGVAMIGASGLKRVEYWLCRDRGTHGVLDPDDPGLGDRRVEGSRLPAFLRKAGRRPCTGTVSPRAWPTSTPATGRPLAWPLPFSWAAWEVKLGVLEAWGLRVPGAVRWT